VGIFFCGSPVKRTGATGQITMIGKLETGKQRYSLPEYLSTEIEIKQIECPEGTASSF
jgi:hypothetical protein